jgi:isopentenyldiphosphate isomerase
LNDREYLYVVNGEDKVVRKALRAVCHSDKLIHRSVYIFLMNDSYEIFIQRRSMSKDMYPGYFTASATGHVDYGESYDEAAERELLEELGVDAPLRRLCKFRSFSDVEKEISVLYVCFYEGVIKLDENEISGGNFMSIHDIRRLLESEKALFANGFRVSFKKLLEHANDSLCFKRKIT